MNRIDSPLERYFQVLERIAISVDGLSISQIAESCDLPIATAHRLLQNLQRADLIVSAGGKRKEYRLGGRLLRLLHAGSNEAWLAIAVQPILEKLANQMAETCYLARFNGQEVLSVAWAAPNDGLRGYVVSGRTLAPHVAASAKAILAFQSKAVIAQVLAGPLPKLTPKTKTSRKAVEQEYTDVKERGFATCWDEMEIGLGAIAVPIHLPEVGVIYSLASAGLIDRLMQRPIESTVAMLKAALDPLIKAMRSRQIVE